MKLNGEFFAKHCAPATFCSAKKFGEIDPWRERGKPPQVGDQSLTQLGVGNPISRSFSFGEREKRAGKEVKPFHTLAEIMKITFERHGHNPINEILF